MPDHSSFSGGPAARGPAVGVLSLQGDVIEHFRALESAGARPLRVRRPDELDEVDGLIIPGGESTTMWKLSVIFEMVEPLRKRISGGMPVFGSCAGMIMLADRLLDGIAGQETLGGIDMTVRRNAFGRQVDSFEADIPMTGVPGRRCGPCSSGRRGSRTPVRTSRYSGLTRAPVGSSRSARARRWPPPSTPS